MQRHTAVEGWLLGMGLLAGAIALGASTPPLLVRIVHISFLAHHAQVRHAGDPPGRWSMALLNAPVTEGESIRTATEGQLEVQLECGSALRLAPDSEFSFPRLRRGPDGVAATTVIVRSGSAFFNMRHQDSRDFEVRIPADADATVVPGKSAEFRVEVQAHAPASVQLMGGHARLNVGHSAIELKKSVRWAWSATQAPHRVALQTTDASERWNHARDAAYGRALLLSQPRAQFAGAEMKSAPGSTSSTPGVPQSAWSSDGFVDTPAGFIGDGSSQLQAIADGPTARLKSSVQIPACARY